LPTGLNGVAVAEPLGVDLSWSVAADDVGPVAYRVFRNGTHVGTTSDTSWSNVSVAPATTYMYAVRAIDAAGNLGDASASVTVTTPPAPAPAAPAPGAGGGGPALPPDLGVALATSPAPPIGGTPADAIVTVFNDAAAGTASAVTATIELPPGSVLTGSVAYERGSGCSGTATLTCALDFLPNGLSTPLRFRLTPAAGTLAVSVSAPGESDLDDNRAALEVMAQAPFTPPTLRTVAAPGRLTARVRSGRVTLAWTRSPDHARVRTYMLFRDGVLRRSGRALVHREHALRGRHVYTVRAIGTDGRRSAAKRVVVTR